MLNIDRPTAQSPAPNATASRFPAVLQVILAATAMFAASYAPIILTLPPLTRLTSTLNPPAAWSIDVIGLVLPTVVGTLVVILLVRLDSRSPRPVAATLGLGRDRRVVAALGIGIAVAMIVFVGSAAVLHAAGLLRPSPVDGIQPAPLGLMLIMVVLRAFTLQAIPEELIFRGYLLGSLRMSGLPAILVSASSFAVLHLVSIGGQRGVLERLLYLLMPFGFAVLAGALRLLLGSLSAAIGVHGGLHLGYAVCVILGFGDGPWLWVTAGVLWSIIGLLLVSWGRPRSMPTPDRPAR